LSHRPSPSRYGIKPLGLRYEDRSDYLGNTSVDVFVIRRRSCLGLAKECGGSVPADNYLAALRVRSYEYDKDIIDGVGIGTGDIDALEVRLRIRRRRLEVPVDMSPALLEVQHLRTYVPEVVLATTDWPFVAWNGTSITSHPADSRKYDATENLR
jgi:hypothetical protein